MAEKTVDIKPASRVFVCGGGHQGVSMAAHLALEGVDVTLWNRSQDNIQAVIDTGQIECTGVISGVATIEKASSDLSEVVSDFVFVATPSSAHKDIARLLAPFAHGDMVIVLSPGRTFGALEFAKTLAEEGVENLPHIAETQTIVHTCRRGEGNRTSILALKQDVMIAALEPSDISYVLARMPAFLRRYYIEAPSVIVTSLSNVGMVLHCAPVLMNIGWVETPYVGFKHYYEGISPSVARFLEKVDAERVAVAKALGYDVETTTAWLRRTYNSTGSNLYECIRTTDAYKEIYAPSSLQHRYLLEDVPNGLVPLEYAATHCGVDTPHITMVIDLACAVLDRDFRAEGRKYL